jgi:capsular exopolysaccharide synthesis family protein
VVVGLVLVFLLEYVDDSIRTREDLEEVWDIPHLGVVPQIRPGEGKFIHTLNPKAPLSEAYRTIRHNILYASFENPPQTMMITSSIPGEGKSTTCANLAASAAMEGKSVLVIDTDFRKPNQHRLWQADNTSGFTAYLAGQLPLEECIRHDVVPGLDLLPSGMVPPNPAKLIESTRLRETLEGLRERYDLIFLDSPPVLVVNDAAALARVVDAYVLVVESMGVSRRMLADARTRIEVVGVPPVGAVMNKLDFGTAGYGYYYKYYNAYGPDRNRTGGGDGDKRRKMRVVPGRSS